MWETEFSESMLSSPLIIHCPDESLVLQLMEILEKHGVCWGSHSGRNPTEYTHWGDYKEETCYWVEDGCLSYADMEFAESDKHQGWRNHITCTFSGVELPDFAVASEDELLALFSVSG